MGSDAIATAWRNTVGELRTDDLRGAVPWTEWVGDWLGSCPECSGAVMRPEDLHTGDDVVCVECGTVLGVRVEGGDAYWTPRGHLGPNAFTTFLTVHGPCVNPALADAVRRIEAAKGGSDGR